jgi:transmembrane sensor
MSEHQPEKLGALEREAYDWVVRFAGGNAHPADIDALRRWAARSPAHAAAFDQASLLWKAAGPAGQELSAEIAHEPRVISLVRPRINRRAVFGGALAASAAAAMIVARPPLGLWPSWSELDADYRTEPGTQRRIALSDHVSIELNTRTSIAVRSMGEQAEGVELIAGEAAIKVVSDTAKPFILMADNGRMTSMADARFNVRCEKQAVWVTCIEGTIQVEHGDTTLLLSAGRQVRYSDQGLTQAVPIDPALVTAWQNGVVIFQSTPVAQVIDEINRYRPGRVVLTDAVLGRRLFNARLKIENIDRVTGQIAELFGARETQLPGGIVLLG